jgi:hypothetical protein
MGNEIKTLNGIMNLDDSNEVIPSVHHKEARNGVFKGNAPEMHFTAIRGNSKVNNASLVSNDCRLSGSALFTPNCTLVGTAVYIAKCELAGTAVWIPEPITMTVTPSCTAYIGSGKIVVSNFAGGWGTFSFIAISTVSAADALARLDASGTRNAITTSSYTYSSLANGTYYIAIMDTGGLKGSTSTTISCEEEPVAFILNHTCNEITGNSTVEAKTFTGGRGTYQISNMLHTSAANALAGTFIDVASATVEYSNTPDGTWYVALRDKANTVNKTTRSVISDCIVAGECSCYTVVNTTANSIAFEFYDCAGNPASVGMPGGSTDWFCVANGAVPVAVEGLTITKCSPTVPCTTTISCYQCGSTDPVWADQNYNTCIDCVTYDVYKDINPNSASAGKYKVNGVIDTIQPASGNCVTTADYSESMGTYHVCIGGQVNEYAIYKNTNVCFTGNQYSRGTNGTITYATNPVNDYPDTDRIMVDKQFNYCYECVTYPVFRDENSCSPTWNEYFVNDTISLGQTTPPAGDCSTATDWRSIAETTCYECANQTIYRDYGVCSPTKDKYRIGLTGPISTTKPTVGNCVTTPLLVAKGFNTCYNCANYAVFRDERPCSATFNNYILNQPPSQTYINVGNTEPSNGNCITTANYQNYGARVCIDCYSKQPQRDENPCSPTVGNIQYVDAQYGAAPCNTTTPSYTTYEGNYHYCSSGTVYAAPVHSNTNVCYSGINTAQFRVDLGGGNYLYYGVGNNPVNAYPSTDANWINMLPIEQYYECVDNVRYYRQMDINQCSTTVGQTRLGAQDGIVAGYCGYNPTTCTSYEIVNFDSNYDLQVDYVACGGSATTEYVGGGMTMTICAEEGTVSIGGSGSVTNIGSCSV